MDGIGIWMLMYHLTADIAVGAYGSENAFLFRQDKIYIVLDFNHLFISDTEQVWYIENIVRVRKIPIANAKNTIKKLGTSTAACAWVIEQTGYPGN